MEPGNHINSCYKLGSMQYLSLLMPLLFSYGGGFGEFSLYAVYVGLLKRMFTLIIMKILKLEYELFSAKYLCGVVLLNLLCYSCAVCSVKNLNMPVI